jgi:hypothetical protein
MITRTTEPPTDLQVGQIRSMALYWREVRNREDQSPLAQEARQVIALLGAGGVLRAAEFCADPVRLAAPDLLAACEALFEHCAMVHKYWGDNGNQREADAAIAAAKAAIAKARGE